MKPVNIIFEDVEMEKLKEAKGEETWHDFVLRKCLNEEEKEHSNKTKFKFNSVFHE